jgi:succinate dehydrogenase hydrophobic anchor subunit
MKIKRIVRPEVEVECESFSMFLLVTIWAHLKVGVKKITLDTYVLDMTKQRRYLKKITCYAIPKFTYKKARADDADI